MQLSYERTPNGVQTMCKGHAAAKRLDAARLQKSALTVLILTIIAAFNELVYLSVASDPTGNRFTLLLLDVILNLW